MFPKALLDIMQCPSCTTGLSGGSLKIESNLITEGDLICKSHRHVFPVSGGVADMSVDLNTSYHYSKVAEWQLRLTLHESWWRNEKGRLVKGQPLESQWRPSTSFIKKYFELTAMNGDGGKILDLGCGEGHRWRHFSGDSYIGIDPLVLRKTYPFPFFRALGEHLPFSDSTFSLVVSVEVFDHLLDPEKTVKEILRILRTGGNTLIFVRNTDSRGQERNSPYSTSESDVHLHHFTKHDFIRWLQDSFNTLEVEGEDGYLAVWGWGKK